MTELAETERGTGNRFDHARELDGLRGVAVTAVVVYHLWPHALPGGFIGVDVFFVLSGFLLSSLLVREVERTGGVAARTFMARRVRRLLPAMLLVLGAIAVYAATMANEVELERLRRHTLGSLTYSINWLFIADGTTYTDVVAGASPLRHIWSLAIEEQFYLALALAVAGLVASTPPHRVRHRLMTGSAVVAVASALWMVWLSLDGASVARTYFGTDTRAQAMLVGVALGAWRGDTLLARRPITDRARKSWSTSAVASAGILVWLALVAREDASWMHRGGFTLVAVASAIVIVGALVNDRVRVRPLAAAPLVGLGIISYGVYLWHWPVLVIFDEDRVGVDGLALAVFRVGLTLVCAMASFRLVERPIRRGSIGRLIGRVGMVAAPVASIAVAVAVVVTTVTPPRLGAERADASPPGSTSTTTTTTEITATDVTTVPGPTTGHDSTPAPAPALADRPSTTAPSTTTTLPEAAGPIRVAVLGDSVAHTLIGGQLDGQLSGIPWTVDQTSFDPAEVEIVPITRPVCSFLDGDVALTTDGTQDPVDLSSFCAGWDSDLTAAVRDPGSVDVTLVLVTNDLHDRSLDGRFVDVGSPEWERLMVQWLDQVQSLAVDADSMLVLGATAPRLDPTWVDGPGVREAMMRDVFAEYAEANDGVETIDFGPFVAERALRYDGLHYTEEGAAEVAAWLTPQLRQLASSSGTGTSG